jgi:hypothetical protein
VNFLDKSGAFAAAALAQSPGLRFQLAASLHKILSISTRGGLLETAAAR